MNIVKEAHNFDFGFDFCVLENEEIILRINKDRISDISYLLKTKEKIMNELRALYNPNEDLKLDEALKLIEKELDTST